MTNSLILCFIIRFILYNKPFIIQNEVFIKKLKIGFIRWGTEGSLNHSALKKSIFLQFLF